MEKMTTKQLTYNNFLYEFTSDSNYVNVRGELNIQIKTRLPDKLDA